LPDAPNGLRLDKCLFDCQSLVLSTSGVVTLNNTVFRKHVLITLNANSKAMIFFCRATFEHGVHFRVSEFHQLDLEGAQIRESFLSAPEIPNAVHRWPFVNLRNARFEGFFLMRKCSLNGANFAGSVFDSECSFESCEFARGVDFTGTKFRAPTSFENSTFLSSSSFKDAVFEFAPNFHNAHLHQGTTFSPAHHFPTLFRDIKSPNAAEYYRTLKLAMNKQQALNEEAGFFLLEMRSRAHSEPFLRRVFHTMYDVLSAYGQSVRRPLIWFLVINIGFGMLYSWLAGLGWGWWQWSPRLLSLTLNGSVPFVGGLRSPEISSTGAPPLFAGFELVVVQIGLVIQTTLSTVLLFLVGLGLRNMFKIR
jgi:uncharacterized protein YjbI with pentapeptide repeats